MAVSLRQVKTTDYHIVLLNLTSVGLIGAGGPFYVYSFKAFFKNNNSKQSLLRTVIFINL